jgi:hypothetical protein
MSVHSAVLITARLLVPAAQRVEWFAEWDAELCYVRRTCGSRAWGFCLGAYKDAFYLRRQCPRPLLDSPLQCLALLSLIAAILLSCAGREMFSSPFRDTRALAWLPDSSFDEYRALPKNNQLFENVAFYQWINGPVRAARGPTLLGMVRASGNLFDVLHVPVRRPAGMPLLVLSRSVWRMEFGGDRHITGRVLEVGGKRAVVAGVIDDDQWPLAGPIDAWLLDDKMPGDSRGSVIGRVVVSGLHQANLPRPAWRFRQPAGSFLVVIAIACLIVPLTTSLTRGGTTGIRYWTFLLAKTVLILPAVYACAVLGYTSEFPFAIVFILAVSPGSILAFRWVLMDQQRRCPQCLRRLSDPVRVGKASHTFLDWYGTEMMCGRGHGILRVPEAVTDGFPAKHWVNLDELCGIC